MNRKPTFEVWVKGHIFVCAGFLLLLVSSFLVVLHVIGLIDGLTSAVDIFIAIIGGIFTLYGSFLKSIEDKKENFKESAIYMYKHYPIVARYAIEIEDRRFKGNRDGKASNYTICDEKWIANKPIPFDKISVKLERKCFDSFDIITDGQDDESPIDLVPGKEIVLKRGVAKEESPSPASMLYKRGKAILPYGTKSFAQNVQLINGHNVIPFPSLALTEIEIDDEVRMTVRLGDYDDFYNTCAFSLYELTHDVFVNGNHKDLVNLLGREKKLLYRKAIDPMSFDNRFAAIGINTLVILKNVPLDYRNEEVLDDEKRIKNGCDKADFFLIHIRGDKVAEGPGLYHVVPAGSYQPTEIKKNGETAYKNTDPTSTVMKEFAEEVLKVGGSNDLISEGWIETIKEKLVYELYFLGIALEPVNLKVEMLSLMVIDVSETNCEDVNIIESIRHFDEQVEGKIKMFPLETQYIEQFKDNLKTAPAGRAIFSLFTEKDYNHNGKSTKLLEYWKNNVPKKLKDNSVH